MNNRGWVLVAMFVIHLAIFVLYWAFLVAVDVVLVTGIVAMLMGLYGLIRWPRSNLFTSADASTPTVWVFLMKLAMAAGVVLTVYGWESSMVMWPFGGESLLLAFGVWLLLILTIGVLRFGYAIHVPLGILLFAGLCFVLTSAMAAVKVDTLVRLRYRNHPEFIQIYEWHCIDPESEELRRQLTLEHNRIVMDEEEFRRYQESHPVERRNRNQW